MRTVLCALLLVAGAAWAVPDDAQAREIAAAKERLQAMLDEAALLEQAGRREEAAKLRADAAELKRRIAGAREKGDDAPKEPLHEALHRLEQAIAALDRAGYEGMAGDLREAAERLRQQIRQREGAGERPRGEEVDFWRRNIDTLRIAMKGLAEANKPDATDMMERAVHAREMMIKGRTDPEAREIMHKGPNDGNLCELLQVAANCWREFKQPDKAERCQELCNFLRGRLEERERAGRREPEARREGRRDRPQPGPEDRMARIEERLDRMEDMLHAALEELEARDRERERGRDRGR